MILLEAGESPFSSSVMEAAKCLATDLSKDPYTLALKAYALALTRLPKAQQLLEQLFDQATFTKNSTHWELLRGQSR